ncbi:MAG: hypothetical protein A3J30_02940 [Candidatus Wildermuthbacteria bacterium RIFCSPLOWO2_02_FULL_47_9c]|uniref:DUF6938 domain-containing protein n=1 Tax=Candidatus Wildermuthbacteria bacterium RIFCSPLOWO2_02_FULL_47_9c TaxID=1802466 RepID=A0A1G2RYE3_9BACT|nr:MAG: hypothetical protein UY38_C0002G0211 [Parcubacteria group bacterium GW2011_GWB1_49_12]KKW08841.1 MAG: hypothetical protein UY45_C0003G0048 [Parcubacteria group bacterium GW2011_GWA1_49_26]OHA61765.1 MAG: hypothetical protein A2109_00250 [Candidatus Wildermuthbacteria bacterium GWA1_49_26]OHA65592.1 MAG: hypothetical protein A2674_03165 [Candidatus Wildermuthbacteria bacterium RIFCSPHIGHO2_01_FULL_50_47]OHA69605.1 MAG: hypothetical protein A3D63_03360 [Candidatus Wildermuthbacteria bacte
MFERRKKAWVAAADMGYGHLRAALPFQDIAQGGRIIAANDYPGIPESDKKIWEDSRRFYEAISRFKKFPVLGDFVFALFDKFQEIKEFYSSAEGIEAPTIQLKQIYRLMEKRNWGRNLIWKLNRKPLPLICTFFTPAHMAEFWKYEGPIYSVVTDTDISRAWAPLRPKKSKIIYCASTKRAAERLKRYGVRQENVVLTGFPLSEEFTKKNAAKAKRDLKRRLEVLDPSRRYRRQYGKTIEQYLGTVPKSVSRKRVVLTFAIGGAGAQAELAQDIVEGARPLLQKGKLELHLIAGVHAEIAQRLLRQKGAGRVFVHSSSTKKKYFKDFSAILSKTDILWTKPSELVFYAAFGIPIIIAPPIGSQEKMNRKWLLEVGAGIDQKNPEFLRQWLPDLLEDGAFAEAAMQGFVEIPRDGAKNIKKLVCGS